MGLFGRKISPEERLAKAREYFEKRDYEHAFLESHRLAGKKDPEACYYVGMYYLNKRFDKKMAQSFIEVAAAAGVFDAPWQLQLITGEAFRSTAPVEAEQSAASEPVQETKPEKVAVETKKVAEAKPVIEEQKPVEPEKIVEEKTAVKAAPVAEAKPVIEEQKSVEPEVDVETLYDQGERMRLCGAPRDALMYYERAAARGHVRSQLAAALAYETGSGTPVDEAKALAWYEKAAEAGSPSACCKCGALYRAAGDDEKALHWYQVAGDTYGKHEGWRECADMFLMGIGTEADQKKALEYYKLCALQDDAEAQCIYGLLSMRLYTAEKNEKRPEAMKWLQKSALHGYSDAQYVCAQESRNGFWSAPDLAGAVYWYQQAAAQGSEEAAEELAALRAEEGSEAAFSASAQELERTYNEALLLGEDFKKCKEATALLLRAAEGGLVKAQRRLGLVCSEKGSNFDVSEEASLSWCARAVEEDDAWAQTIRARYYERGFYGSKKDLKKALALYELAGEQGNLEAQLGCGRLLRQSCDETLPAQEYYARIKKAADWYMRAAQQDCLEGLLGVGRSCEQSGDHFCTPAARKIYERASKCIEEGDEKAKMQLGKDTLTTAMLYGRGMLDYNSAMAAYKEMAELGCTDAYDDIFRLIEGEKVHVQLEELYFYIEKAAQVQNQRAQVMYAIALEEGSCPQFDPVLAKRYAQDALTSSDPDLREAARKLLRNWKR